MLAGDQGEAGRMDLLTVVMHEIGRVLGRGREDAGIMQETLVPEAGSVSPRTWSPANVAQPAPSPTARSAVPIEAGAGEVESFVVLTVADDARVRVGPADAAAAPPRPPRRGKFAARPARAARIGAGIAPDLGVGTSDEAGGAATEATDGRPTGGRPPVDDASPEPPSIAATSEGVAQLVGWVLLRTPLQGKYLINGDDPDDLWGVNVDGVSPRG